MFLLLCLVPMAALAAVPLAVEQETVRDVTTIENPEARQVFYGTMASFPHTYEIVAVKPFRLYAEVRMPDVAESPQNVSGIIIREKRIRGVEEVARMKAVHADWERVHEPFEDEWYWKGGVYTGDAEAGVYRIEVSTPTNVEPYVLIIGTEERDEGVGYIERVKRVVAIKQFVGKSAFAALGVRTVYLPPLVLMVLGGVGYLFWRQYRRRGAVKDVV